MILVGNQRGNAKNLAHHLLKQDNERVEVHDMRGFCSDNLVSAFNESYAMSRATKCKQHLFSLSLNPPKDAEVSNEQFEDAIGRVEVKLGLSGQPRAIVFHEKNGRRHCHAVWSRIDAEEMKAVHLSYSHRKLQSVSRELYLEHGWKMPRGLVNSRESDPRNYTLAQWQQAKRVGKDAAAIKTEIQDAWAISDSKEAFSNALAERGYKLARGDRRGYVAVDHKGEVYSLSRAANVKSKQLQQRLGDMNALPSVTEAKARYAEEMLKKMQEFQQQVERENQEKARQAEIQKQKIIAEQKAKREAMAQLLKEREQKEERIRQERIRHGLLGLLDRVTGKRKHTLQQNEQEKQLTTVRDTQEKKTLVTAQLSERERFIEKRKAEKQQIEHKKQELQKDVQQFEAMKTETDDERSRREFMEKRHSTTPKTRDRGPSMER